MPRLHRRRAHDLTNGAVNVNNDDTKRKRKRQREQAYALARALGTSPSAMRKAWDAYDEISDPKKSER